MWGRGGRLLGPADSPPQAPRRVCGSPWTVPRQPSSPTTRWSSPSRAARCESPTPGSPVLSGGWCGSPAPAQRVPPGSYVLTLITDGMRSVRAFHFDKAAASVLTTSVSGVSGGGGPGSGLGPALTPVLPSDGHHGARIPVPWLSPGQLPAPQVHGEAAGAPCRHRPGGCRQGGCGDCGDAALPCGVALGAAHHPTCLTGGAALQEEARGRHSGLVR